MIVTVVIIVSFFFATFFFLCGQCGYGDKRKKPTSGNSVNKSGDLLKKIGTSFHHPFCKLGIAHLIGNGFQPFQGYPRAKVALILEQRDFSFS